MAKKIKLKDLVAKVNEIAGQRPEFVYTDQRQTSGMFKVRCSYLGADLSMPRKGEACIIGQALSALGMDRATLADFEGSLALQIVQGHRVSRGLSKKRADRMSLYLHYVQAAQDQGESWGEAVKIAKARTPITR